VSEAQKQKKKCESQIDTLQKRVQEVELALKKSEADKVAKENQIRSLQVIFCWKIVLKILKNDCK